MHFITCIADCAKAGGGRVQIFLALFLSYSISKFLYSSFSIPDVEWQGFVGLLRLHLKDVRVIVFRWHGSHDLLCECQVLGVWIIDFYHAMFMESVPTSEKDETFIYAAKLPVAQICHFER